MRSQRKGIRHFRESGNVRYWLYGFAIFDDITNMHCCVEYDELYWAVSQITDADGHPIFLVEELTLETVMARAYQIAAAGDTDGWRMHFSVLYGDTLVEVRTKAAAPEWVYEQLIHVINP